jgi:hypothetical protein
MLDDNDPRKAILNAVLRERQRRETILSLGVPGLPATKPLDSLEGFCDGLADDAESWLSANCPDGIRKLSGPHGWDGACTYPEDEC